MCQTTIQLPPPPGAEMSVHQAITERRSRRSFSEGSLSIEQVSEILYATTGITDKSGRLRSAPSAGATYPIDTYILVRDVAGIEKGIYRYILGKHALELVKKGDFAGKLAEAGLGQSSLAKAQITIALFGVFERTTGRYGKRGEQYVHNEIGHIGQNIYLIAEALGLSTVAIGAFHENKVSAIFGVDGIPLYLMPVGLRAK